MGPVSRNHGDPNGGRGVTDNKLPQRPTIIQQPRGRLIKRHLILRSSFPDALSQGPQKPADSRDAGRGVG